MARHRSVRKMNYEDEFCDEDDVEDCYGQSFDDKYCISPGTVAQFTFPRKSNLDLGSYMGSESPPPDDSPQPQIITPESPKGSSKRKTYNSFDEARLNHCLDKIHEVLGDIHQDDLLAECIKKHNYDTEAALNELLTSPAVPKPQRQPREGRKSQDLSLCDLDDGFCVGSGLRDELLGGDSRAFTFLRINSVGEEESSSFDSVLSDNFDNLFRNKTCESEDGLEDTAVGLRPRLDVDSGTHSTSKGHEGRFVVGGSTDSDIHKTADSSVSSCQPLSCGGDDYDVSATQRNSTSPCLPHGDDNIIPANIEVSMSPSLHHRQPPHNKGGSKSATIGESSTLSHHQPPDNKDDTVAAKSKPKKASNMQELMNLFAKAKETKEQMEKDSKSSLVENSGSGLGLDDGTVETPWKQDCTDVGKKPVSLSMLIAEKGDYKCSLADLNNQRTETKVSGSSKLDPKDHPKDKCCVMQTCEKCLKNNKSRPDRNKTSLADLTKSRLNLESDISLSLNETEKKESTLKLSPKPTQKSIQPSMDFSKSNFAKTFDFSRPSKYGGTFRHGDLFKDPVKKSPLQNPKKVCSDSVAPCSQAQTDKSFSLKDLANHRLSEKESSSTSCSTSTTANYPAAATSMPTVAETTPATVTGTNSKDKEVKGRKQSSLDDDVDVSLGDLISQVNLEHNITKCDQPTETRLEDLFKKPTKLKPNQENPAAPATSGTDPSCSQKENKPESLNVFVQKIAYKEPVSLFGKVISYRPQRNSNPSAKNLKYPKFSYKVQTNGVSHCWKEASFHITPFDFSTPSPDDIVKTRRKQAYHHHAPAAVKANC